MSAPLNLSPEALHDIAYALSDFAKVAKDHHVEVGAYGTASLTHRDEETGDETVLSIELGIDSDGTHSYRISDRIGD